MALLVVSVFQFVGLHVLLRLQASPDLAGWDTPTKARVAGALNAQHKLKPPLLVGEADKESYSDPSKIIQNSYTGDQSDIWLCETPQVSECVAFIAYKH